MAVHPAVLAAAFCLILPLAALAGTADPQRDACTPDAMRLCHSDVSNVARTTACLVAHRAQLRSTCRNVFAFAEPAAYRTPPPEADRPRPARVRAASRTHPARARLSALHRRRARVARRVPPYHIPRFDQAQAEAEVHTQYRYRTPYLPYWVFP